MMTALAHLMLVLTLALAGAAAAAPAAAPAVAPAPVVEGGEGCPNPWRQRLSPEELRARLLAHRGWLANGGARNPDNPGKPAALCNLDLRGQDLAGLAKAALCNGATPFIGDAAEAVCAGRPRSSGRPPCPDLSGADFRFTDLTGARLEGIRLYGVDFRYAILDRAYLEGADLTAADFGAAGLIGARLEGALLSGTRLGGARLAVVDLEGACYGPNGLPDGYLRGIEGLHTVFVRYYKDGAEVDVPPLVQLRKLLQEAGLREREREVTYAIEHNKTYYALGDWRARPRAAAEAAFRWVAFELPVGYGLYPGRALLILLGSIAAFALIYTVPLLRTDGGGIYRIWSKERIEGGGYRARIIDQGRLERLHPRGRWGLGVVGRALQFSALSAFHLGWRELNVGSWIARVQTREYTLRGAGWVRAVAGVQSLLSVYLLALWALTYFGRPFQ